ncbi:MAG: hypothetical protein OXF79_29365 [Chloroflexi bacterium]|nr:hypothetical protein [Chloroflexota bacterium]
MTAPILDLDLPPEHPLRQILDFITAHPEVRQPVLRALLTEDFLALPVQVQELSGRVDGVAGQVEELTHRVDGVAGQVEKLTHRVDGVAGQVEKLTHRVDGVAGQVDELRGDLGSFKEETREQFRAVNTRIDETNTRIDESADSVVRRMEGSLGRFRGETYEKRCLEKIDELLANHFGYAQPLDREPINRQLAQVRQDGTISRQEYLDGRNVDIIAHDAFASDGERRWAVVEVSITFNRNDLENSARRAAIIAQVFGVHTRAFVVTNSPWPDDVNAIAEQMGVTIVRSHDPVYEAQPL